MGVDKKGYRKSLDVYKFKSIKSFSRRKRLESKKSYEDSLDKGINALIKNKGIVELKNKNIPTIIISDLHARREYLFNVLQYRPFKTKRIYDLLKEGKVNIVCAGDGMNSEIPGNWVTYFIPYSLNFYYERFSFHLKKSSDNLKARLEKVAGKPYEEMKIAEINRIKEDSLVEKAWKKLDLKLVEWLLDEEMISAFGLMKLVMELKSHFPENFHFVRGNHDDISMETGGFAKFANESTDVKNWVVKKYGQEFLDKYAKFVRLLPLIVKGNGFVVSHSAPEQIFNRQQINRKSKKVIRGLTWTDNTEEISLQEQVIQTLKNIGAENSTWLIGHRKVLDGNYRAQYGGKLVQFNHHKKELIGIIPVGRAFNPEIDIIDIRTEHEEKKPIIDLGLKIAQEKIKIGDKIKVNLNLKNKSDEIFFGAAILEILIRVKFKNRVNFFETIQENWRDINDLAPGKIKRFTFTINTSDFDEGDYIFKGTALFNAKFSSRMQVIKIEK